MRKIIALLLIGSIIFGFNVQCASAASWNIGQEKQFEDILYIMLKDGTLGVSGIYANGKNKTIRIPEKINGYKVSTILSLDGTGALKEVIVPEGVTTMQAMGFGTVINTLSLPASLTTISDNTFMTQHFTQIKISPKNPTFIVKNNCLINKNTGYLLCYPRHCMQTSWTIPEEVKKIDTDSFFGRRDDIKEIKLSSNLTYCDFSIFPNAKIIIPKNMTKLPVALIDYLTSDKFDSQFVSRIEIEKGNKTFSIQDNLFIDNSEGKLISYIPDNDMLNCFIPDNITTISANAFKKNYKLEMIKLPGSTTKIGNSAFEQCKQLVYINIPASVHEIGKDIFKGTNGVVVSVIENSYAHKQLKNVSGIILIDSKNHKLLNNTDTSTQEPNSEKAAPPTISPNTLATDNWTCPNCGNNATESFCNKCGTSRPAQEQAKITEKVLPNEKTETASNPTETISEKTGKTSSASTIENESMVKLVSYAKSIAELIAYTASDPIVGNVIEVKIGNKTVSVHAEFKYAMDVFYIFYKEYYESIIKGDIVKMMSMIEKADEVDAALEKIDDMDLSDGDMAYYLKINADIINILANISSASSTSIPSGNNDIKLDDLSDILAGLDF